MPHAYKTRNACKRGMARAGAVIQDDIPETVTVEESIEQVVGGYAGTFTFSEPVELSDPMIAKRFCIVVIQPDADAADTTTKVEVGEQAAKPSPRVVMLERLRALPPHQHRHPTANQQRRRRNATRTRRLSSTSTRKARAATSQGGRNARSSVVCCAAKAGAPGATFATSSSRRTASPGRGRRKPPSCVTTCPCTRRSAFARSSTRTAIIATSPCSLVDPPSPAGVFARPSSWGIIRQTSQPTG